MIIMSFFIENSIYSIYLPQSSAFTMTARPGVGSIDPQSSVDKIHFVFIDWGF